MPERTERHTVRLTENKKSNWKDYAESDKSEFSNLSDMIRFCVEREIEGRRVRAETQMNPKLIANMINREMDAIIDRIDSLEEKLSQQEDAPTPSETVLATNESDTEDEVWYK